MTIRRVVLARFPNRQPPAELIGILGVDDAGNPAWTGSQEDYDWLIGGVNFARGDRLLTPADGQVWLDEVVDTYGRSTGGLGAGYESDWNAAHAAPEAGKENLRPTPGKPPISGAEYRAGRRQGGDPEPPAPAVFTANSRHGVPLTQAEQNMAVQQLLSLGWTQERISAAVGLGEGPAPQDPG
jgi:hypothetical protein